jgi:tetratricopeptide (TPR) repeat protein
MRKFTILCALICVFIAASAQNKEEENIKKAVQAKLDAYQAGNLDGRKNAWLHDATVSNTFISHDGYNVVKGWDSLSKMMDQDIRNPKPEELTKTKLENFSIRNDGSLAWVEYDMIQTPVTAQASIFPYTDKFVGHVYEFLVKESGQWKTRNRIVTAPGSYATNEHNTEAELNSAGYVLLFAKKLPEAIEIFKLNVKLFPDSWNVYDSLGEAYAAAGDTKEAIENYEKSIQLNPKSDLGKATLAKLKQK